MSRRKKITPGFIYYLLKPKEFIMAKLHASLQSIHSQMSAKDQTELENVVSGVNDADQGQLGGILINIIALLKQLGLSVNFPCLISTVRGMLPALIAAFATGGVAILLLIPDFIAAYTACSHPAP